MYKRRVVVRVYGMAYLRSDRFYRADECRAHYDAAMARLAGCGAVVVDLAGNGGGSDANMLLASYFMAERMLMNRIDVQDTSQRERLSAIFAAFVESSWNEQSGEFRNFMGYARNWLEASGSEDSCGRTRWALGATTCLSSGYGERSSMKRCTCAPTTMCRKPVRRSPNIWASITAAGLIRRLTNARPTRLTSARKRWPHKRRRAICCSSGRATPSRRRSKSQSPALSTTRQEAT